MSANFGIVCYSCSRKIDRSAISANQVRKFMSTTVENVSVLGISGQDGAGKGYLTEQLIARHQGEVQEVGMITTRPARPGDSKVAVSDTDFDAMIESGQLIGAHTNDNGYRYAYRIEDLIHSGPNVIIEINPDKQGGIVQDLARFGIKMAGWIGVLGDEDYVEGNMIRRQPDMDAETRAKKMGMGRKIATALRDLEDQGIVTIFPVGWTNRETMADQFSDLVEKILFKQSKR